MFSMAGIPPLSGFFGKLYVFLAAVQSGLWTLAVIGVLTSVVGAFYYLRIVKVMYFDAPAAAFDPPPRVAVVRRRGDRAVHHVLLPLPRAVRRRGAGGGEGAVLDSDVTGPAYTSPALRAWPRRPATPTTCDAVSAARQDRAVRRRFAGSCAKGGQR